MQCRDAQFYLRLRRQAGDELGSEVSLHLDRHLAHCPACAQVAAAQSNFDRALGRAMQSVAVPPGLKDRLFTQAATYRGTVLRHKAYRVAAMAASVFLTVGLAFGVFSITRPRIDTNTLVRESDEQFERPEAAISEWLARHKMPPTLPLPFDPDLLVSLGTEQIQGRPVAVVCFARQLDLAFAKMGVAKVYIFQKGGEFDTRTINEAQGSHTFAKVIDQVEHRGFVYVIVAPGPDLAPFLRRQIPG
jgi:hypothetical protein